MSPLAQVCSVVRTWTAPLRALYSLFSDFFTVSTLPSLSVHSLSGFERKKGYYQTFSGLGNNHGFAVAIVPLGRSLLLQYLKRY